MANIIIPQEWLKEQTELIELDVAKLEAQSLLSIFASRAKKQEYKNLLSAELGKLQMINRIYTKFITDNS